MSILNAVFACLLAGVLVAALFAVLFGMLAARRLTARRAPDPPATPGDYGLRFEEVTFPARDGLLLCGWFLKRPRTRKPRPTIVLCPGHDGSMGADLKHAPWLSEAGFDLLLFDWRAHGKSEGRRVSMGVYEQRDLLGALDYLDSRGVTSVGLLGFSMGGAVALRVAAADDTGLVHAVVSDCGFARVRSAVSGYFTSKYELPGPLSRMLGSIAATATGLSLGTSLSRAAPLPVVANISPRPVLFVHGAHDPYVPLADQDALYNAARNPRTLWRVHDAGHRDADVLHPGDYRQRITAFFKAHLAVT